MMSKSDVNGDKANDVWKLLRLKSSLFNPKSGLVKEVPWNFSKFLVSANLEKVEFISPRLEPAEVIVKIEKFTIEADDVIAIEAKRLI